MGRPMVLGGLLGYSISSRSDAIWSGLSLISTLGGSLSTRGRFERVDLPTRLEVFSELPAKPSTEQE
jgi:hypothetical protein